MEFKTDSRKIKKGDTFIAIKEAKNDGHEYVLDAINNGASKVVVEKGLYDVETLIVRNTHDYLIEELDRRHKKDLEKLKLIGITGTNGKTTSCYILYQSLNKLGFKCAYIGTIGFYDVNGKVKDLNNTTPDIVDIYEMLLECANENYDFVAMEVSSHALDKKRIGNLKFDYTIFTNLTEDHLDYHKTINQYLDVKLKLFEHLKEDGKGIVNIDDKYSNKFICKNMITYGMNDSAEYSFNIVDANIDYSLFNVKHKNKIIQYKTKLIGNYNIYNLVSIMIILDDLNLLNKNIISELNPPRGRMEKIKYGNSLIIIDYAHTPDATLNILKTIKELNSNNIYTIIGCGGNRDKFKRPIMADIAATYSDYVIFTSDNPRDEDPSIIIEDMIADLKCDNYEIEIDRESAINKGIKKCRDNDILLILGKGHETYQLINGIKHDFDDLKIVFKYVK